MRLNYSSLRYFFYFFIISLIVINIILIVSILSRSRGKGVMPEEQLASIKVADNSFYNALCPEVELVDLQGNKFKLSSMMGEVIVLKFTRLLSSELPSLIYMDHVLGRLKEYGLKIFFIYPTKRSNPWSLSERVAHLSIPIVRDDSTIMDSLNAEANDTIIIGKDFRIKFKHNYVSERTIYNQIVRFLKVTDLLGKKEELSPAMLLSIMEKISYQNIDNGRIENIGQVMRNRTAFINLFISTCFGCPVGERIEIMKEVAARCRSSKTEIFFLFGTGNNLRMIEEYAERNQIFGENIRIGVIQKSEDLDRNEYYSLFDFKINPRLFIINKEGENVFNRKFFICNCMWRSLHSHRLLYLGEPCLYYEL